MKLSKKEEAQAFLAQCLRDGKVIQFGAEATTRRWTDQAARRKYHMIANSKYLGSETPCPAGSIPLKQALTEIGKQTGLSFGSLKNKWRNGYSLPLKVMRKVRTRVDVDPASVPDAIAALRGISTSKPKMLAEKTQLPVLTDYAKQLLAMRAAK